MKEAEEVPDEALINAVLDEIGKEYRKDVEQYKKIFEDNWISTVGQVRKSSPEAWSKWDLPSVLEDKLKDIIGLKRRETQGHMDFDVLKYEVPLIEEDIEAVLKFLRDQELKTITEYHSKSLGQYFQRVLPVCTPSFIVSSDNVQKLGFDFLYGDYIIGNRNVEIKQTLKDSSDGKFSRLFLLPMTSGAGKTKILYQLAHYPDEIYVVYIMSNYYPPLQKITEKITQFYPERKRAWQDRERDSSNLTESDIWGDYWWIEEEARKEVLIYLIAHLLVLKSLLGRQFSSLEHFRFIDNGGSAIVRKVYDNLTALSYPFSKWVSYFENLHQFLQKSVRLIYAYDESQILMKHFQDMFPFGTISSTHENPKYITKLQGKHLENGTSLFGIVCRVAKFFNFTDTIVVGTGLSLYEAESETSAYLRSNVTILHPLPSWSQEEVLKFIKYYINIPADSKVTNTLEIISASLVGRPRSTVNFTKNLIRAIFCELPSDFSALLWKTFEDLTDEVAKTFSESYEKLSELHNINGHLISKHKVLYELLRHGQISLPEDILQIFSKTIVFLQNDGNSSVCLEPLIIYSFKKYLEKKYGLGLLDILGDESHDILQQKHKQDTMKGPWGEALFAFILLQCSSVGKPITEHSLFIPLKDTILKNYTLEASKVSFDASRLSSMIQNEDTSTILVIGSEVNLHADIVVLLRSIDNKETLPLTVSVKVRSNRNEFYKGLFLDSTLEYAMKNQYGTILEDNAKANSIRTTIENYLAKSPASLCISFHWKPANISEIPVEDGKAIYFILSRNSTALQEMLPKSVITSLDKFTNEPSSSSERYSCFRDKKENFFTLVGNHKSNKRGRPKKMSEENSKEEKKEGKSKQKRTSEGKRKSEKRKSDGKRK